MASIVPPSIIFQGRLWTGEELRIRALAWRRALAEVFSDAEAPIAMVLVNRPESVALFFALSSFRAPVILLPPDPSEWLSSPPIPGGTRLILSQALSSLASPAAQLGLTTTMIDEPENRPDREDRAFLTTPGVILLTSGSTSRAKPVYRRTEQVLAVARDLMSAAQALPGTGIVSALPIARGFGFNTALMAATVTGSLLALQDRFDPRATLELLASGRCRCWTGTPMMADLLSRAAPRDRRPAGLAAPICCVAGRVSDRLAGQFEERLGVPLRQVYGSTEAATITADVGTTDAHRGTAGQPLPGARLSIGDGPRTPVVAGATGRIWISAARYLMEGYGFPPDVEPREDVEGWWPTPDIGHVDGGRLTVTGRLDDCFRTDAGQLVDTSAVAEVVERLPGITDVVTVPVPTAAGLVLGVLAECREALEAADLRRLLAQELPAWAQPHVIDIVPALPRLPNGKVDRRACIARLETICRGPEPQPGSATRRPPASM